jgi:predicted dehydrogenase
MQQKTRRDFVTAGLTASTFLNLNPRTMGANEKVTLALIGGRNQGKGDATRAIQAGAVIKTFCDLDEAIFAQVNPELAKAQGGTAPGYTKDFRRVLDDKDIDGVIVATPDHWHTHIALQALSAGKDLYIEKPVTQTIYEGQLIRDAARKFNRVVQVGTQRRSQEHITAACDYVASGKLGKVCLVKAWMCQVRATIGKPADSKPPSTVDYDVWLGPAPLRPFNENRFHYNWRFFWDYCNAEIGNQGIHVLDVALQGIQKLRKQEKTLPKKITGHGGIYWLDDAKEVPDTQMVAYDFGDLMLTWELRSFSATHPEEGATTGAAFYGTDASVVVDGRGWSVFAKGSNTPAEMHKAAAASHEHEQNFIECIKSRKRPNADIEVGRISTTLCHLGNIACNLGREIHFDAEREDFGNDAVANARLRKTYRDKYPLPKV